MVDDIAVQEFIKAIKEQPTDTNTVYNATVSRVDTDGTVWVNIHGSDMETPTASTSTEVKRGDAVTVNWRNNKLYIAGNYSNPSAGVTRVSNVEAEASNALDTAETAQASAIAANALANNAMISANGKNSIYYDSTAPTGGTYKVGDTWFNSSEDNAIYTWSGSAWVKEELGEDAIANLSITNAKIADATIQNGKIANLDAAKITTGTLDANRIAVNSITANKIRVGDYNNYVTVTENDVASLTSPANSSIVDGWVYKSNASADNLWASPVLNNWTKEGEKYRVTGKVKTPADGRVYVVIYGRADDALYSNKGSNWSGVINTVANTETDIDKVITITSSVAPWPKSNVAIIFYSGSSGSTTQTGYFKQLRVERMSSAELIVDGSITADKIASNAITIGDMDAVTRNQLQSTNMLVDYDASTTASVYAGSARYWGGNSSTTTQQFFAVTDPPEANIHYGGRITLGTAKTSEIQSALAFYAGESATLIPYKVGTTYTLSCWARCTSGSGRVKLYYRNNASAVAVTSVTALDSSWKRVYGTFTPTVVDYGRVYFYANFAANTTGTVEMCGFKLVANGDSAEATKYITAIDNNGIRVHAANNPTSNYAKIDANGMEVYKGGNKVAKFGQTIELSDGTRTLYDVTPLSGAATVTRVYNDSFTPDSEAIDDIISLGRTVTSWSSITVKYKTSVTGSVLTKTYSSGLATSDTVMHETNFKFDLAVSFEDTTKLRVSIANGATLTSAERLTVVSIQFKFNTSQTAIESTLGAYADKTQTATLRVGNGTGTNALSNAFATDFSGNGFFNGDVFAKCNSDSSGGISLGTVKYIPSAYNYENDSATIHMDIGVNQIGMVVFLDIECWKNSSIAAGSEVFDLDISKTEIPLPEGNYVSGMMYYNNRPLGIRILEGESSEGGAGIRFRIRNCSASAVTVSSSNDGARGNLMYISSGQTCADYYYEQNES